MGHQEPSKWTSKRNSGVRIIMSKPLKRYEKIALLKNDILHMQLKFDKWESLLGKELTNFEHLQERNKLIEANYMKDINNIEPTKAQIYEYLQSRIQALRTFDTPKAKPKPKPNGNGKKKCDICNKEFTSKGYPSHRKKCERIRAEELRVEELKKELESDLEGEE